MEAGRGFTSACLRSRRHGCGMCSADLPGCRCGHAPGLSEQLSAGCRDSKKECRPAPSSSSLPALSAGTKGGWALSQTWSKHGEIGSDFPGRPFKSLDL